MTAEVDELKKQKEIIERQLNDKKDLIRKFEGTDLSQIQDQSRWNFDLTRMDNELGHEQEKNRKLVRENEQLKADRVGETAILKRYKTFDE